MNIQYVINHRVICNSVPSNTKHCWECNLLRMQFIIWVALQTVLLLKATCSRRKAPNLRRSAPLCFFPPSSSSSYLKPLFEHREDKLNRIENAVGEKHILFSLGQKMSLCHRLEPEKLLVVRIVKSWEKVVDLLTTAISEIITKWIGDRFVKFFSEWIFFKDTFELHPFRREVWIIISTTKFIAMFW